MAEKKCPYQAEKEPRPEVCAVLRGEPRFSKCRGCDEGKGER